MDNTEAKLLEYLKQIVDERSDVFDFYHDMDELTEKASRAKFPCMVILDIGSQKTGLDYNRQIRRVFRGLLLTKTESNDFIGRVTARSEMETILSEIEESIISDVAIAQDEPFNPDTDEPRDTWSQWFEEGSLQWSRSPQVLDYLHGVEFSFVISRPTDIIEQE